MELYDKKNDELSRILSLEHSGVEYDFSKTIERYFDLKVESLKLLGKKIPGNLILPYLEAMKHSSLKTMDHIIQRGLDPSYHLLYKHHTILMEYLANADQIDRDVVSKHLDHIRNLHSDQPDTVKKEKIKSYLEITAPYNLHDAVMIAAKRNIKNGFFGSEKDLIDTIKIMSDAGSALDGVDRANYSALHWSIIEGNPKVSMYLIRAMSASSCSIYNDNGETALSLSAKSGNYECTIALLNKGVTVSGHGLKDNVDHHISKSMIQKLESNNPLLMSLRERHVKVSLELVKMGAKFDSSNNTHDMHTGLIYAAKLGSNELLQAMLKSGYAPNDTNSHGFTPLHYLLIDYPQNTATAKSMINSLILAGAKLDLFSKTGVSATDCLVSNARLGNEDCQNWLFERNVEKLKDFVRETAGLEFTKISDLVINDENLADMRLSRVEEVNSVWLNRGSKTQEYKKSLADKGLSEIKKAVGVISAIAGGTYSAIDFVSDKIADLPVLSHSHAVGYVTQNIVATTVAITALSAAISALDIVTDKGKRYAVTKWCAEGLKAMDALLISPAWTKLHYIVDKSGISMSAKLAVLDHKMDSILRRIKLAVAALKGELIEISHENTSVNDSFVEEKVNIIEMPSGLDKDLKQDNVPRSQFHDRSM